MASSGQLFRLSMLVFMASVVASQTGVKSYGLEYSGKYAYTYVTIIEQQPEQKSEHNKKEEIIPKLEEKMAPKKEQHEHPVESTSTHQDPSVLSELKEKAPKPLGESFKLDELMKPVKSIEKELGSKIKQPIKGMMDKMTAIPKKITDTIMSRVKPETESGDDFEGDESDEEERAIFGFLRKPADDEVNHEISKREIIKKLLKKGTKVGAEAKKKMVKEEKQADIEPIKEDKHVSKKSKPQSSGIYVSTGPNYFAIVSPKLEQLGWKSISVNNDEAFIVKSGKNIESINVKKLDDKTRNQLEKIQQSFSDNLNKVVLNNPHVPNALTYPFEVKSAHYETGPNYSRAYSKATPLSSSGYANSYSKSTSGSSGYSYSSATGTNYESAASYSTPFCSIQNYENLHDSKLNKTLDGDIYYLDLFGNALDVFSTTVSLYCKSGLSVVYRDENYFVYSKPDLPHSLNRIVLIGTNVIFIYNDGVVLAKPNWALENSDLKLVLQARIEVEELLQIRNHNIKNTNAAIEKELKESQKKQDSSPTSAKDEPQLHQE